MDNPNHITGAVTPRERGLLDVLHDIVMETMDYPVQHRADTDSYLPEYMVKRAQHALGLYGLALLDYKSVQEVTE